MKAVPSSLQPLRTSLAQYRHGTQWLDSATCRFALWAPAHKQIHLVPEKSTPLPMQAHPNGWHVIDMLHPPQAMRYRYQAAGVLLPDPVSHFQPEGIDGPSELVTHHTGTWQHPNPKRSLQELIIYEMHVGTFTPQGTFTAAAQRLGELASLGITAIELMPIAQFSGSRNWGYDGVFPYAVQNSYGGPAGLQHFVDTAHGLGLSVVLDVVYNHLGPEGNILHHFGPYLSRNNHTPWGPNPDFNCAQVREYVIQNALHWLIHYRIDGLRLDAVQCIHDAASPHIIRQLADTVARITSKTGRKIHLIAESDENDIRTVLREDAPHFSHNALKSEAASTGAKGKDTQFLGLDAQWSDDFHHALHAALTGERVGFYSAYGSVEALASTIRDGFYYTGQYNRWRKQQHGFAPRRHAQLTPDQFIVYAQNHDMIGNRPAGERLGVLAPETRRLTAAVTLLSPFTPLLFMGDEYGETAPFPFFTDYSTSGLKQAVTRGRNREMAAFGWQKKGPSPSRPTTFASARLHWEQKEQPEHNAVWQWYKACIALRRYHPALQQPCFSRQLVCQPARNILAMGRWAPLATAGADSPEYANPLQNLSASLSQAAPMLHTAGNVPQVQPQGTSCWLIANMHDSPVDFRISMLPRLPEPSGTSAPVQDAYRQENWQENWQILLSTSTAAIPGTCVSSPPAGTSSPTIVLPPYGILFFEKYPAE